MRGPGTSGVTVLTVEWESGKTNLSPKFPSWDFPGGPVVKTLRFQCRGARVLSLLGEVPHAMRRSPEKKKKKVPFLVLASVERAAGGLCS